MVAPGHESNIDKSACATFFSVGRRRIKTLTKADTVTVSIRCRLKDDNVFWFSSQKFGPDVAACAPQGILGPIVVPTPRVTSLINSTT